MTENQTHHWITKTYIVRGKPEGLMLCAYCGVAYSGGIHNEEVCPEAPK